ncbi:uncharacterized protein TRIADDRAFT_61640 [Trichoplax adhaerens]|uniref:SEFIR domain-containing protein n=1 Tax=Trichoplax adhaerens TaxID=10228 RepID=B3SBJ7_TRIAD|nr:predicted protein [Trichoplax adhaerens]EDV19868.1 predicted protein [Trichoplax adhaerens]|eukprot:XP_002117610.1 predicted protein [Trichoplax adhaerens]
MSVRKNFSDEALWRSACARVCREEEVLGNEPLCLLNDSVCRRACEIPCHMKKYDGVLDCEKTCSVEISARNWTEFEVCKSNCKLASKFFFIPLRPYVDFKNLSLPEFEKYIGTDLSWPDLRCNDKGFVVSPPPQHDDPSSHRMYEVIVTDVINENSSQPLYRCKVVKEPKLDLNNIDEIFPLSQIHKGLAVSIIDAEPRYLLKVPQYVVKTNSKAALYVNGKLGLIPPKASTPSVGVIATTSTLAKTTVEDTSKSTTDYATTTTAKTAKLTTSPPGTSLSEVTLIVVLAVVVTVGAIIGAYFIYKWHKKRSPVLKKEEEITKMPSKLVKDVLPPPNLPVTGECQNEKCIEQYKLLEKRVDEILMGLKNDRPVNLTPTTVYIATANVCPTVKTLMQSLQALEYDCALPAMEKDKAFEVGDGPWTFQRLASASKIIMIVSQELLKCISLFEKTLSVGDSGGTFSNSELRMICEWKYALSLEYDFPTQSRLILAAVDDTDSDTIKSILTLQSKSVLRLPADRCKILAAVTGLSESDCRVNITVQKTMPEKKSDQPDDRFEIPLSDELLRELSSCEDSYASDDDSDISDNDTLSIIINENRLPPLFVPDVSIPIEDIGRTKTQTEMIDPYAYA